VAYNTKMLNEDLLAVFLGYRMDDKGSIPGKGNGGNFFLRHRLQIGSGAHPATYSMGTGSLIPGMKWRDVKLTTHLQLVPTLRIRGDPTPLLQYVFRMWCSIKRYVFM